MNIVFNVAKYLLCIGLMALTTVGVFVWCVVLGSYASILFGLTLMMMSALYAYGTMRLVTWLWVLKYEDFIRPKE